MQTTDDDDRVKALVRSFEGAARRYYDAMDYHDFAKMKKAVQIFYDAAMALDSIEPGHRTALASLFDHEHFGVRVTAAIYLVGKLPDQAVPLLRDIADMQIGDPSIRARIAVFQYDWGETPV